MAGTVELLQRCFAGVETRDDALWLNPFWPEELGSAEFTISYRDHPLVVRVTGTRVRVTSRDGLMPPITVGYLGEFASLRPGETLEFPLGTSSPRA